MVRYRLAGLGASTRVSGLSTPVMPRRRWTWWLSVMTSRGGPRNLADAGLTRPPSLAGERSAGACSTLATSDRWSGEEQQSRSRDPVRRDRQREGLLSELVVGLGTLRFVRHCRQRDDDSRVVSYRPLLTATGI